MGLKNKMKNKTYQIGISKDVMARFDKVRKRYERSVGYKLSWNKLLTILCGEYEAKNKK